LEDVLSEPPSIYFFHQLMSVLPEIENYLPVCDQYFSLLENLLKFSKGHDLAALLDTFKKEVINHHVIETSEKGMSPPLTYLYFPAIFIPS
jgi:hypothetical protein